MLQTAPPRCTLISSNEFAVVFGNSKLRNVGIQIHFPFAFPNLEHYPFVIGMIFTKPLNFFIQYPLDLQNG